MGPLTPDAPCSTGSSWGQRGADRRNSLSWGHFAKKARTTHGKIFLRLPQDPEDWKVPGNVRTRDEAALMVYDLAGHIVTDPRCRKWFLDKTCRNGPVPAILPSWGHGQRQSLRQTSLLRFGSSQSRPWDKNLGPSSLEVTQEAVMGCEKRDK